MSENDQYQQRLKKQDELRALGADPYNGRLRATHSIATIAESYGTRTQEQMEKEPVHCALAGRIMTLRRFGKAAFAHIQDAADRIQVYFKQEFLGEKDLAVYERLDIGDLIGCDGILFRTRTGELTLQVQRLVLLTKSLRPLPEKWHGLTDVETRYRQRYLDLISNPDVRGVFIQRSRIIAAVREFLNERGFLEVETPMMQPIPGGAAARPFITHHNTLGIDLYLRIAPELYLKRLIVGGLERVYEINRNFRNEGVSTVHNPEFTMLEFYQAYADYFDLMTTTEELFGFVAKRVLGALIFPYQNHTIDLTPPWRRLSFHEAIRSAVAKETDARSEEILNDREKLLAFMDRKKIAVRGKPSRGKLQQELFEAVVEPSLIQPTFITDYPTEISPLAKRKESNPELTDRFELFINGLELANAFSELNDSQDQRRRFEDQMKSRAAGDLEAHPMDEDYLRALEHGMPPTAGEGVGIDRLVMLLTNQTSIRDVILFPQLRTEKS
ncbi:MAG: lysine--tRNA ligase [Nitrospirae bacterium]|nr:lysine--tRNA ligase [Nitrospirota bacterium]